MTPSGLVQKGDRLRNTFSGEVFVVTERIGRKGEYSVRVQSLSTEKETIILELPFWIRYGLFVVE